MHCPKCGQQQLSEDTRFCSRCGFLLTGIVEVIANGGVLLANSRVGAKSISTPRKTGLKQGLFIFLLSFLLVPLAIARPRFSAIWLLPVVLWVSPKPGYAEGYETFAPAIVAAIMLVLLLVPRRSRGAEVAEAPA